MMPTFESLGIHRTLAMALRGKRMKPTPFQARVLEISTTDFADIIVDGRAAKGYTQDSGYPGPPTNEQHDLIMIFLAHCVLSEKNPSRRNALVLASDKEAALRLQKSAMAFAPQCQIAVDLQLTEGFQSVGGADNERREVCIPSTDQAGLEGCERILITTLEDFCSLESDYLRRVTTFASENSSSFPQERLEAIIGFFASCPRAEQNSASNGITRSAFTPPLTRTGIPVTVSTSSTNIFLMYLEPLVSVSAGVRYKLNRKKRRYYQMEAEIRTDDIYNLDSELRKDTAPGVSIQPVYLLYRDDNDHIELLRRILQEYPNHRVLLLTHHKEVRPMYQLISRWNIFGSNGSDGDASPGSLSCMLRTDTVEQQEAVLLRFVGVSTSAAGGGGGSGNGTRDRGTPSLLIAWDAFTAADIMDIDVLIQYYPPQKSIEQRERVEFMHVLHTTADPRVGAEGRRTVLFTLLAPSDFTLVDFFMQQNGLRMFVMNIAPRHPHFGTCVSNMGAVLRTKLIQQAQRDPLKEEAEVVRPVPLLMSGGGGVYSSFSPSFRTDRLPLN